MDNPIIRIHINKIKNRIIYQTDIRYYLELLMPETMKLLGNIGIKITRDKHHENVPHLEITEVILVHLTIFLCTNLK